MKWWSKVKWMVTHFEEIKKVVAGYSDYQNRADWAIKSANQAVDIVKERTTIGVDVSPIGRDPHVVFICGRYKNHDYVQLYSLEGKSFEHMVDRLREERKHGTVSRIDAPMGFERNILRY